LAALRRRFEQAVRFISDVEWQAGIDRDSNERVRQMLFEIPVAAPPL
jgi:hypothetical protein